MSLPTSAKEFLKIGDALLNTNCKLLDLSKKVKSPISELLSTILRFNLGSSSTIKVFVQVSEIGIEVDEWVHDEEHKVKRIVYENYLGNSDAKPNLDKFRGFLCLQESDLMRLIKKKSISVKRLWENDTEYVETQQSIEVSHADLLIDTNQITLWIASGKLSTNFIVNTDLANHIKTKHSGDASDLLKKIESDNAKIAKMQLELNKYKSSTSPRAAHNRHNLSRIIAGLTILLTTGDNARFIHESSKKPNYHALAEELKDIMLSYEDHQDGVSDMRGHISSALKEFNVITGT